MMPLRPMPLASRLARDASGATALELALLLPVFIAMLMGGMAVSILGFAVSSLHFAVEDAARCSAVRTTVCSDASSTQAFAAAHYKGPAVSQVFSYSTAGCGHTVSATGTLRLNLVPGLHNVPLSATACYPS